MGALLGKSGFIKKLNRMDVTSNRLQHQIKNGAIVLTYLGMLCIGKPYFESVHEMDDDRDFYKTALGITRGIPSEETLRQRMDDIGDSLRRTILEQNVEMLLANKIQPTALANGLVPVDIDVTPMDNSKSKKEGVSRTYKGFDGYAPMMAYIGTEGYAINFELREGKQHCQKGTVEFLQETINLCRKLTDKPLLIRLDSGNDSIDNVAVLMDAGCFFIIKRNLRRESTDDWFEMAKQYYRNVNSPRDGKLFIQAVTGKPLPVSSSIKSLHSVPATRLRNEPLINMVSSILFPILRLKPGGQTLVTRMRKSSVCIMPMGNVSSFTVR